MGDRVARKIDADLEILPLFLRWHNYLNGDKILIKNPYLN